MTFEPPATRAAPDIPAVRGTPDGNTWELTLIPESAAFACAADGRRIAPASATVSTNRADMSLIECILNPRGLDRKSFLPDGVLASGTPPELCRDSRALRGGNGRGAGLDRQRRIVAPFGPRSVVDPHELVAGDPERERRMGGPDSSLAVGDELPLREEA